MRSLHYVRDDKKVRDQCFPDTLVCLVHWVCFVYLVILLKIRDLKLSISNYKCPSLP